MKKYEKRNARAEARQLAPWGHLVEVARAKNHHLAQLSAAKILLFFITAAHSCNLKLIRLVDHAGPRMKQSLRQVA